MKAKLSNGTLIECTPEEWLIIQKNQVKDAPPKEVQVPIKKDEEKSKKQNAVMPLKFQAWSDEEQKILLTNAYKPTPEILELLPNRTASAINQRLSTFKIKRHLQRPSQVGTKRGPYKRKEHNITPEDRDRRSKRMTWVNERAKYFVNTYQWSYEKAKSTAAKEYDSKVFLHKHKDEHQTKMTPFKETEFPMINPINTEEGSQQFESVLKNLFSRPDGNIGYYDIKWISGVEWNGRVWHNFLINIFSAQKKIFEYFMTKGKLIIDKDGNGYEILRYEKESVLDQEGNIIKE